MIDGVFQADLQGRQDGPIGVTLSWEGVLAIMGSTVTTEPGSRPSRADTVAMLSTDPANDNSVVASLERAREGRANRSRRDQRRDVGGDQLGPPRPRRRGDRRHRLRWPVLVRQLRQGPLGPVLGVASRTMLRDEAYAFLDAGGRFESATWCCGCCVSRCPCPGSAARRRATGRRSRCSARSVAAGLSPGRCRRASAAAVASFLLYTRSYPDSVAASIDAVRSALSLADANSRASEPVLRLSRVLADLDFRGRVGRREGSELARGLRDRRPRARVCR